MACAAWAAPSVGNVSYVQGADGVVSVSYTLSGEAAIVTFGARSGASELAGAALRDVAPTSGCWKVLQPGTHTIWWRPHAQLAADMAAVSVTVQAWSTENPPPVMVVDLASATAAADRVRYYPSLDHLPGGLLENAAYRTSKLVFKKVMGVGATWQMGAPSTMVGLPAREYAFAAQLARNYYLGVFEFTQGQYRQFAADFSTGSFSVNRAMRPLESVAFNEIRCNALGKTAFAGSGAFADAPYAGSLLDLIRTRTGVAVDLPTDAEWEFACKAGDDGTHWDNGAPIRNGVSDDVNMNGRHRFNGGYINGTTSPSGSVVDIDNGTAQVGSYAPNAWGFYDMHGNVFEFCLDWYEENPAAYGGAVNIDPADATQTRGGTAGATRVRRGGSWHVGTWDSRPTSRLGCTPTDRSPMWGFRPLVAAGTATGEGPVAQASSAAAALTEVGGQGPSAAGALEARAFSRLESEAVGIRAEPVKGFAILFR